MRNIYLGLISLKSEPVIVATTLQPLHFGRGQVILSGIVRVETPNQQETLKPRMSLLCNFGERMLGKEGGFRL